MQKTLKGVIINSEDLQSIAKEFGKVADKFGTKKNNNIFMDNNKIYIIADGFLLEKTIETQGEVITKAIPIGEFRTNINALPNKEEIIITSVKNALRFCWGEKGSELLVNASDDLIASYEVPKVVQWIEWKAGTIHEIYRSMISFVASEQEPAGKAQPILTGVYLQRDNDYEETYLKATDKRKAASISMKIEWFDTPLSIPATTLSALFEAFSPNVNIHVGINENGTLLVFKSSDTTVVTRVLNDAGENKFPDIDKSFTLSPKNAETTYRIDLQKIVEACYMATKLSPTGGTMQIRIHENKVYAFTKWDDESKSFKLRYFIGGSVEGKPEPIAVNASHLLAAAKLFEGDEISLLTPRKHGPITVINDDAVFTQALIGQIVVQ